MNIANVLEFLESSVEKYPHKKAVDDGERSFTYVQLLQEAKRIGTVLTGCTAPGKPVVIFMEKSAGCLAALLGCVYAGCFYVVVHPVFPEERIRKMIKVLEADAAITGNGAASKLVSCGFQGTVLEMEDLTVSGILQERLDRVRNEAQDTDLVYGMFTSGSTGTPKMVVVSHRAIIDFIEDLLDVSGISERDIIGNQAPFDFDVSVKDIFSTFAKGGTLILIARELFSQPLALTEYLKERKVTVLIWAVTALSMLAGTKQEGVKPPDCIRKVMFSGEVMPQKPLQFWIHALPEAEFYNLYGPTEVTCNCTWYKLPKGGSNTGKLPIGLPFSKRKIYLWDDAKREILKPRQVGEICVGGSTLASGYYHNEKAQDEKFICKACEDGSRERIYCTGDLGYYDEEGLLYFAGRKDFQIKRMGHRIEMEEVELEIGSVPGVERACCIYDDETQTLLAFYTGEAQASDVRREVRGKLPAYMLPNRIIRVEEFFVTKNGKTDRGHLRELGAKYFKKRLS
ncbi:amino acid adenylation domain-containing protein [Lachnospiraceae bacterium 45-W7]